MTTYYVSSIIGSNNNVGTSANAPLASLQAAANMVKPGDTVQVMNGTYTAPGNGDALDIRTSGTASAPITFEAAPGQTPVINSSGGWQAVQIEASYIVVKGFTVVGDAANYNLQSALAGYSTGNASLDGNGIAINPTSSVPLPNHITIENNTVYNEPGGGIYTEGADYVQILNNVVHNNANWSAFGNSGISISTSANLDTNSGPHDIISGNLIYNNAQLVPTNGAGIITDGEGIILDTNPKYTNEILVQNNTVYGNGGPGIESYLTNNATITGNTVYGNNTGNVRAASNGAIFITQSSNNTVTNNTLANNSAPPSAPAVGPIAPPVVPTISGTPTNAASDFTGDGTSDVLLQNGGTVVDWIMKDGVYQSGNVLTTAAAGWDVVGTGDFTGSGTDDVLLQNGGSVVDWIMNNGVYQSGNVLTTAVAGWSVVGTGDFTGSGTDDVVLQNGGTVVDWIMKNGAYESGNVLTTGAAGWKVVGTGDFSGNGTDDVLLQNGGTVVDWVMQNGKYVSGNVLSTSAAGFNVVGAGDYNGDGTSDILLQNGGTVVDWIMKDGHFASGNVLTTAASGWRVTHS